MPPSEFPAQSTAGYRSDGSAYPDWSAGETKAIEYAALDLVKNFTGTDYAMRLHVLHDLLVAGRKA